MHWVKFISQMGFSACAVARGKLWKIFGQMWKTKFEPKARSHKGKGTGKGEESSKRNETVKIWQINMINRNTVKSQIFVQYLFSYFRTMLNGRSDPSRRPAFLETPRCPSGHKVGHGLFSSHELHSSTHVNSNGPYASLAAMFSNRVHHFDCVINCGC